MASEIGRVEPRDVDGIEKLDALGRNLYEVSRATFFRHSPRARPGLADLKALRHLPVRHGWGNYARTVAKFLHSPYLRQIYNRYPTYVGSSPYLSPATLLLIPYMEREFGAWYVRGGLYAIVESVVNLARCKGVTLLANSRVAEIDINGKRAVGVRLADGTRIGADVVVMNGDAAQIPELLGARPQPNPGSRSMSGFVVMIGVLRGRLVLFTTLFCSPPITTRSSRICSRAGSSRAIPPFISALPARAMLRCHPPAATRSSSWPTRLPRAKAGRRTIPAAL